MLGLCVTLKNLLLYVSSVFEIFKLFINQNKLRQFIFCVLIVKTILSGRLRSRLHSSQ